MYFGAALHIRTNYSNNDTPPHQWDIAAATAARIACWRKPLLNMEAKAAITAAIRKSPSLAAKGWNIYTRPCIYYPAQTAEPCAHDLTRLRKA
eukprot:11887210-Heterocapsa_arctica.AAC.1